jgi:hypothetical protein
LPENSRRLFLKGIAALAGAAYFLLRAAPVVGQPLTKLLFPRRVSLEEMNLLLQAEIRAGLDAIGLASTEDPAALEPKEFYVGPPEWLIERANARLRRPLRRR